MGKTAIKQKLNILEAEVKALRLAIRRAVDFTIDDANWQRLKATLKARTANVIQEAVWLSLQPSLIRASS